MKKVALKLRIELAQYREVAAFARLSSDLDAATAAQIRRGERLTEVLKQPPHSPMPMALQVFALWAAVQGHIDDIPVTDVMRFQTEWMEFLERGHGELGRQLMEAEDLTPAISAALEGCMRQFRAMFVVTGRMDEDGRDVEDGALGEQEMPAEAATGKA
jgi:F-type H+-transporting ATPase subunit alpha